MTRTGHVYTPKATVAYEKPIKWLAHEAMQGREAVSEALRAEIYVTLSPPASWSGKRRREALEGLRHPTGRPDLDNYVKSVLDGCAAVVFTDDKVVVELFASKRYAVKEGVLVRFALAGTNDKEETPG